MKSIMVALTVSSILNMIALLFCLDAFNNVISMIENTNIVNYKSGIELGCAYNNQMNIEKCREFSDQEIKRLKELVP